MKMLINPLLRRKQNFTWYLMLKLHDTDPSYPGLRNSHSHRSASQVTLLQEYENKQGQHSIQSKM